MASLQYMVIWSIILFIVFLAVYIGIKGFIKINWKSITQPFEKRKQKQKVDNKMASWREGVIPPNRFVPFLPLIPFFIVVYIFLNHMVFFAVITSDSMYPTFEKGDIVLMQTVDKQAEKNDIIMFQSKEERGLHPPVIHRVYNKSAEGIETKGDATNKLDDWIVEDEEVEAKALTFGEGKPIVIKGAGSYFIQDYRMNGKYQDEFKFTSLMVGVLKDMGLGVFIGCVGLYIILTIRDVKNGNGK